MKTWLLVLWIALIGTDRLDFAGGEGPFIVTPFLVLTPLLVMAQAADRWRRGVSLQFPEWGLRYAGLLVLFLTVIGATVYWSLDPESSGPRVVLVMIQSIGTLLVALHVVDDPESRRAMQRGAVLGLLLFVVLDVLAALHYVGVLPQELELGSAWLRLESYPYAGLMPRLSGTVLDPNRAGFILVFYIVLSPKHALPAGALILPTVSRSAALTAFGVLLVRAAREGAWGFRFSPRALLSVALALALVAGLIGRSAESVEFGERVMDTLTERFDFEERGSGDSHQALIVRGVEEGTRSVTRLLGGLGWGASHLVLQDFFPGNRYGNFHSLYASAFAEAGIFACLLISTLVLLPLFHETPMRGMVLGTALFNIFYQSAQEPTFWFILALAWLTIAPGVARAAAPREALA